ncbi:hypothetical protein CCR97_27920 [Rhodoplanes elegans]|nr:hypothetical protein [Rhodoplanes elegans]
MAMLKTLGAAALVALTLAPSGPAAAQDALTGGLLGGAAGAIIGGAATGRAGGAIAGGLIGGAAGAIIGAQAEQRRGGFYWYEGRCYQAVPGGYQRVQRQYCY